MGLNEAEGPRHRSMHSMHPCRARALLRHASIASNGLPESHCLTARTVFLSLQSCLQRSVAQDLSHQCAMST